MWKNQLESFRNVALCFSLVQDHRMDRDEAIKRAKIFAGDLQGIIGQLPMEKVVAKHIDYFQALRAAGVTWPQISELMKSVTVRRKDGKPVPPEQWRAMVSRCIAKVGVNGLGDDETSDNMTNSVNVTPNHQIPKGSRSNFSNTVNNSKNLFPTPSAETGRNEDSRFSLRRAMKNALRARE